MEVGCIDLTSEFEIHEGQGKEGGEEVEVEVVDPMGDKLDVMTERGEDGVTNVSYVPKMPGIHRFGIIFIIFDLMNQFLFYFFIYLFIFLLICALGFMRVFQEKNLSKKIHLFLMSSLM